MTRAQLDQDNSADGVIFILLYNITVQESLDSIVAYRDDVLRPRDKEGFRVLVIGIHCPADYQLPTIDGGEMFARSMGGTFMEMGLDDRNVINTAVNNLIRDMRLVSPEPESGSSRTQSVTYERNAGLRTRRDSLESCILSAEVSWLFGESGLQPEKSRENN